MEVKLVSRTVIDESYLESLDGIEEFKKNIRNNAEALIAYVARVSAPDNQKSLTYEKLIEYCIRESHWSVFEMSDITFEIQTSRAIAQQIVRHRSFSFQEFSQRYAKANLGYESIQARRQDMKNRQNSIDDMSKEDQDWFHHAQQEVITVSEKMYDEALKRGIAKEQARFLLPLNVRTKLYMKGSLRSWIHYVNLRGGNGTQQEHIDIAQAVRKNLVREFPIVSRACGWISDQG